MKPHPRIRKTIKWGGAALTVLLVVVWIASGWVKARWCHRSGLFAEVSEGRVWCMYAHWFPRSSFRCVRESTFEVERRWRISSTEFSFDLPKGGVWSVLVPIWSFAVPTLIATALAFRLDTLARRRARMNLCPKCHYDRTGLSGGADAVCPECGTAPRSPAHSSPQRGDGL